MDAGNFLSARRKRGLDHDVSCIQCGYNLRMLRQEGICPECGRSIAESVADFERKERERGFEPWPGCRGWLRRQAASPALMLAAIALTFVPAHDGMACYAAAWALAIAAIWSITWRPGSHKQTGIRADWRWTLRVWAVGLLVPLVLVLIDLITRNGPNVSEKMALLFAAWSAAGTILFYAYLGIILWQIGRHGWARVSAIAAFAGGIAAAMSGLGTIGRSSDYPQVFQELPVPGTISPTMAAFLLEGDGLVLLAPPISVLCSVLVLVQASWTFWSGSRAGRR